jgi:hypothetical protein
MEHRDPQDRLDRRVIQVLLVHKVYRATPVHLVFRVTLVFRVSPAPLKELS